MKDMTNMNKEKRPSLHLICNAHLDPVWQWRWTEGASEALATFRAACEILQEHTTLIFNHNEAVLYRWVERYDPALFAEIRRLVSAGRWAVAGGWHLQPDVNLPGAESLIRQIAEGRLYFREKFGARPAVATNFDSFGHGAGLPQILHRAGYELYVFMRPQADDLGLPADLFRWRGVDGSEIPAYRISAGLYHTERDNIERRLEEGTALALRLGRDVPVFWGLGNHGGGATREDLRRIDAFAAREKRVRILHGTTDGFWAAIREAARTAPVFEGELQRVFPGCYTSLSRLKRAAVRSLGRLVQTEALCAAAWSARGADYPESELREAWRAHLFNDFHDVITGTCVETAEQDALDLYGKVAESARKLRLGAAAAFARGSGKSPALPVTVLNANPGLTRVPVEFEVMADYRPPAPGPWHMRLFGENGKDIPCQEEQAEALLPFNAWRRKIVFLGDLPGVGAARYTLGAFPGKKASVAVRTPSPLVHAVDKKSGLVESLKRRGGPECLAGGLFEPLAVVDEDDSWGTGSGGRRKTAGRFRLERPPRVLVRGPVRTIVQSVFGWKKSRVVMETIGYPELPFLEFRLRVHWNEERRRLKLRIPGAFDPARLFCEIPAGAVELPPDDLEHVHGRWFLLSGRARGRDAALGVASSGQHGLDFRAGEARLSVLRSSAYCHERGFRIGSEGPVRKFADLGVHEIRLMAMAGEPDEIKRFLPALADGLAAPPAAFPHLPSLFSKGSGGKAGGRMEVMDSLPPSIRLLALKRSWDGRALIVRLQESTGKKASIRLKCAGSAPRRLMFSPFEIKTLRIEKGRPLREVALLEET
ncbi:MAG: hypothetical protein SCM96_14590 [Acidobacteriota bacterium]|nr:hypothetical protein [Acidobacteriota bacterium]